MSERGPIARARRARPWEHGQWALQPQLERSDPRDKALVRWIEEHSAFVLARLRPRRSRLRRFAETVIARGEALVGLSPSGLETAIEDVAQRLRKTPGEEAALIQAFALIREVTGRELGLRHYPSQIMAGRVLHNGDVAQLATGEGKTITGLLPAITSALSGLPVHLVTVNPYLAARDCETLRPVIEAFGLSVGLIDSEMSPDQKRQAYGCDVAFVTNKDLCFDYLRDLQARGSQRSHGRALMARVGQGAARPGTAPMLRGLPFALLDEVDLVLVDEARIPLIISGPRGEAEGEEEFRRALDIAADLRAEDHFRLHPQRRSVELTKAGKARLKSLTQGLPGLWRAERARVERIEQALAALHLYANGHDYVVLEDQTVQIVDAHTGRISPGRSWERGLHQLIELKEGVPLTGGTATAAKITYQRFFRRYMKLAGMTGTAQGLSSEFWRVFGLRICPIPTHRPPRRKDRQPRIYRDAAAKWAAVADRARTVAARGQPVLIGTLSVESSTRIAELLRGAGAQPMVLNALQDAEEAAIIAQAGQAGTITIATSMAGRGTDIALGPGVEALGGLHVIVTEPSESRRVDRQLIGRAGRQGDAGSSEAILSLEDELFRVQAPGLGRAATGSLRALGLRRVAGAPAALLLRGAQSAAEQRNGRLRRATLKSDRDLGTMLGFAGRGE